MHAMTLPARGARLQYVERPDPVPGPGEVRVRISACGVCRTDLHVVDGELPNIIYPIVPGHEVVGRIDALGRGVSAGLLGARVGVPWLGSTCGHCPYCREGKENLCDNPVFTGYTRDGGIRDDPGDRNSRRRDDDKIRNERERLQVWNGLRAVDHGVIWIDHRDSAGEATRLEVHQNSQAK